MDRGIEKQRTTFTRNPDFYSVQEAAEYLGLHRDTVYALIAEGQIPAVRLGRTWRIPRETLRESLSRRAEDNVRSERERGH